MKYKLELVVFLCGLVVMVLEMTGSRIMAPFVGSSTYIWTSLIGVILTCLSLGYYFGGKLADKNASYNFLSVIILLSSIYITIVGIIHAPFQELLTSNIKDIRISSIITSLVLFGVPSILLGIVSPYAAKLKIDDVENVGQTVGNLYALSTAGSIIGTFLGGYIFTVYLGSIKTLFLLGLILLIVSILSAAGTIKLTGKISSIIVLLFLISLYFLSFQSKNQQFVDIDTEYQRVQIFNFKDLNTNKIAVGLKTSNLGTQSASFLDNNDLVFDYLKFFDLSFHFNDNIKNVLMLGGGAFTYPKYCLETRPEVNIDVVEIDPGLTKIAKEYFNFKNSPRLKIYNEDGRVYINQNQKKYDSIVVDVFKDYFVPSQMTTKEFVTKMHASLNENGVVAINLISALKGDKSEFLGAVYNTYKAVFPHILLFQINSIDAYLPQNILMIALKSTDEPRLTSPDFATRQYLKHLWKENFSSEIPALTDDLAPAEHYTQKSII